MKVLKGQGQYYTPMLFTNGHPPPGRVGAAGESHARRIRKAALPEGSHLGFASPGRVGEIEERLSQVLRSLHE